MAYEESIYDMYFGGGEESRASPSPSEEVKKREDFGALQSKKGLPAHHKSIRLDEHLSGFFAPHTIQSDFNKRPIRNSDEIDSFNDSLDGNTHPLKRQLRRLVNFMFCGISSLKYRLLILGGFLMFCTGLTLVLVFCLRKKYLLPEIKLLKSNTNDFASGTAAGSKGPFYKKGDRFIIDGTLMQAARIVNPNKHPINIRQISVKAFWITQGMKKDQYQSIPIGSGFFKTVEIEQSTSVVVKIPLRMSFVDAFKTGAVSIDYFRKCNASGTGEIQIFYLWRISHSKDQRPMKKNNIVSYSGVQKYPCLKPNT